MRVLDPDTWGPVGLLAVAATMHGCVDTSGSREEASGPTVLAGPEPIALDTTDPVPGPLRAPEPLGPYVWNNVAIKGGGFVTGIVFSPAAPNLIYVRTDVGGAYRYDITAERWVPITDFVAQSEANLMGIESVAVDPRDPAVVYLAAGTYLTAGDGAILRSEDFGNSWTRHPIGVPMGGNHDGRSMGERLAVDPTDADTLYFASRTLGLWVSRDAARTWGRITAFPETGDEGLGLSFVHCDPAGGAIYVGVASVARPTLFRSRDAGASWEPVPGAPIGAMPHHLAMGPDGVAFLAYNTGPGPNDIDGGAIWRFDPASGQWSDVSPPSGGGGFGGVAVDASRPGVVMVSTMAWWAPDEIYRSIDGGETWRPLAGLDRRDPMGAEWLTFGGGRVTATGWMGDLEIDPFNRSRALHITGQGIWWSDDVTNLDAAQPTEWRFRNDGLEETVALDLVSPPDGAPLITALGDIGGFRHDDLGRSPPRGMFDNPVFGNTDSLDVAEREPELVVRVGVRDRVALGALSEDGGATWHPMAKQRAAPRNVAGSVAISADGATIVWAPQSEVAEVTTDRGATWQASRGIPAGARVAADRMNPLKFYGVDREGVYVSDDGARTFTLTALTLPRGARVRPTPGIEGDLWVAADNGLLHSTDSGASFEVLPNVARTLAVGFGAPPPGTDYPALYLSGVASGIPGIFRSEDGGATFVAISDERHQFGWVGHISGDPRIYGRVYLGTGGRGVIYGDPL